MTLTLYTYDWLPDFPRGFVRDLRVRWALEELGRPYRVDTVPVHPRSDAHRAMQPFAQIPMIRDGDRTLFESGAILLYLGEDTPLLPEAQRAVVTQWLVAALITVEMASGPWMNMVLADRMPEVFGPPSGPDVVAHARATLDTRLDALEQWMSGRDWIVGDFSIADIAMVSVLRDPEAEGALGEYPALTAYLTRATARPAFKKALEDHMAHWRAADVARGVTAHA